MKCVFKPTEERDKKGRPLFKCINVGCVGKLVPGENSVRDCKGNFPANSNGPAASVPGTPQRLFNFTRASIAHLLKGNPTCSDEQIQERLDQCAGNAEKGIPRCEYFSGKERSGICTHEKCGCNISDTRKYLNKLAWADQQCPIGKWKSFGV